MLSPDAVTFTPASIVERRRPAHTKRGKALSSSDRDYLQRLVSDVVGGRAQRKNSQALYGLVDGPDVWVGAGEARPGVPLTRNDAVRWASASIDGTALPPLHCGGSALLPPALLLDA